MSASHRTWVLALGVAGCAHGASLELRVDELAQIARQAREEGAYRCAPEELARAEAELEFARAELELGDPVRAEEHVVRASANARAARRMSADASCRATRNASPEAFHTLPIAGERLGLTHPSMRRGST